MRFKVLTLAFGCISLIYAQSAHSSPNDQLAEALVRLQSPELSQREIAFQNVMAALSSDVTANQLRLRPSEILSAFLVRHPDRAEEVKTALIRLLNTENNAFLGKEIRPGTHTEEDEEHFANVIDAVSSINDEGAIPALVGAMTTGGMATRGLVKFGDKALGPVIEQMNSTNALMRSAALGTAVTILRAESGPAATSRIEVLLESSLEDGDSVVRAQAVMLIDCFDRRLDFTSKLQQVAANDPARFPGKEDNGTDGEWYYPVRVQARRVLGNIQANKTCRP